MRVPTPDEPMFTVGQVSAMLQVQQAFLRRLESHNLIQPERSDGNQRRYSRADVDQLVHICGLVDDGLTLAGISRILELEAEVRSLKAQLKAAKSHAQPRN